MKKTLMLAIVILACSCQMDKVLYDFRLGPKPEGYAAPSDAVMGRLPAVGETELKRMNTEGRHGEIKFQSDSGLTGKYYKEVKVYESAHPLEASATTQGSQSDRGFVGLIEFAYRIYQSERKSNRTEAAAESATIPTETRGRETYRYKFGSGGAWDGGKGERVGHSE